MATGPMTSDGVPLDVLRTRRQRALNEYNSQPSLRQLLCEPTWQDYFYVNQNAKVMRQIASDTERAPRFSVDEQYITLPDPKKYGLATGVTQDSIHFGVTEAQVMDEHNTAIQADIRLQNQIMVKTMLTDGQWWDATAAPPRFANNTMASSHDHYLAYDVAGVLALTHINRATRHIREHGISANSEIICLMNGDNLELLGNQAEWISAVAQKSDLLETWQKFGYKIIGVAGGATLIENDYVPENYALFLDINAPRKPLAWRSGKLPNTPDTLQTFQTPPNSQYYLDEEYVRWASAAVQMRSSGVAMYLGHGTWTDPTVTEWAGV